MARNFRRQRTSHPIAELNVTNLIDLGFMLLIIFMIVANPQIQQEQTVPLNLPTVAKSPQQKADKDDKFIAVGVDAAGKFYIGNKAETLTLTQLRSRLRAYSEEAKPPVLRIRGDAKVPYQKVMELFAELQKVGLYRVSLDSLSEP